MPKIQKGYKQTEIGVIPEDWDARRLGDIGEIKMCKRIFNHQTEVVGDIPFFKIGTFGKEPDAYISKKLYSEYRKKFSFPRKGDILISAAGTVGRTIVYDGQPSYFQDSNIVWIDNNETFVSNEYLYYVFQVVEYRTEGGTIQRLYNNIIKQTNFVCPPKPEQKAIAEVLSDTDALIERLGQLIEKKRWIKQGAMQRLLTGKQRLPGFTKKWERVALGLLLDYEQPTKYLVSSTEYDDGFDTPVLTVGKTFLLGRTNERHGIFTKLPCIIFDDFTTQSRYVDFPFKAKSSAMKMLLPKSETENLRFISEQMQRIEFTLQGHKRYWISEYAKLEISLPEPKEQEAIISILSDMDTEIESLERQRAKYRNIKQGMMQSLLTGRIRLPLS